MEEKLCKKCQERPAAKEHLYGEAKLCGKCKSASRKAAADIEFLHTLGSGGILLHGNCYNCGAPCLKEHPMDRFLCHACSHKETI